MVGYPKDDLFNGISQEAREHLLKMSNKPARVNFRNYFGQRLVTNENGNLFTIRRLYRIYLYNVKFAAIDLLERILVIDATQRITCEEALEHP